jgi:hypothetical protein
MRSVKSVLVTPKTTQVNVIMGILLLCGIYQVAHSGVAIRMNMQAEDPMESDERKKASANLEAHRASMGMITTGLFVLVTTIIGYVMFMRSLKHINDELQACLARP